MKKALGILAIAALSACRVHYIDPPSLAVIALTVSPDPLRLLVTCPAGNTNCFGSLDATATITESAGVGGRVDYMDVVLYNVITAHVDSQVRLGTDYLRQHAGTDRIEPNGLLSLRAVAEGYPFPVGHPPQLELVLAVHFIDDRGNVLDTNRRVPLS